MKQRTKGKVKIMKHVLANFVLLVSAGIIVSQASALDARPVLSPDDCSKCHDAAPAAIEANGMAHKTAIGCTDCHQGHPPKDGDIIPKCSMCHSGAAHYDLTGCNSCHTNPHTPLVLTLSDNLTAPCLTCHTEQNEQLQKNPTMHTQQTCSSCHHTTHGYIPNCTECHSPHSNDMVQSDCLTCHQAHMPMPVVYPDDISGKHCAACHEDAYNLLQASPSKHKDVACADCHKSEHKMIPQCQDCHGVPHPQTMMSKFPVCGDCHGIAHDLRK